MTRQAQLFFATNMAIYCSIGNTETIFLIVYPLELTEANFSIRWVEKCMCIRIKRIINCNCQVQALFKTKDMTVVKVVLLHRLNYVNTLFTLQYVNFVASVGKHGNQEKEAAQGTHFGWQRILAVINEQFEWLAELVALLYFLNKTFLVYFQISFHFFEFLIIIRTKYYLQNSI